MHLLSQCGRMAGYVRTKPAFREPDGPTASPRLVLVIVCAGVVLASLDLFIVNVALPQMASDFHLAERSGRPLVGAERVRDRVRRIARAVRPARRALPPRARLPARSRGVRRRIGGVRRRDQPADAGRVPRGPGRGRGAADADLARADSRHLRRPSAATAPCATWTAVGGLAAALGPAVGGLLVAASWRWVFLVNVPVGLRRAHRRLAAAAARPGPPGAVRPTRSARC